MGTRKLARERYVRGNGRIRTGGGRGREGEVYTRLKPMPMIMKTFILFKSVATTAIFPVLLTFGYYFCQGKYS